MTREIMISESEGRERELPPVGLCHAICCYVEDLGLQHTPWGDKSQILIGFELEHTLKEGDYAGQRFILSKTYTKTFGGGGKDSNLKKDLVRWRGKDFTAAEMPFNAVSMIGKQASVNVVHATRGDKTYANIDGIMPAQVSNPLDSVEMTSIPEWIREKQKEGGLSVKPLDNGDFDSVPF